MSSLQLKQLETVWHTVIHGYNLSLAAKALHTSQSSLSKQILALEAQLKADIFCRQGKRLTGLTPMGQELLPHIESVICHIRQIKQVSLDFNDPNEGTLTVATTHTQARYVLPAIIKRFCQQYPKVNLVLTQSDPDSIAKMVMNGQADIGIATESLLDNSVLRCQRYYDWAHLVVIPKEHKLAAFAGVQDGVDLPTLASYPLVTYHGGFTGRGRIDQVFAQAGFVPQVVLSALDADVISTYVLAGLGVGIIAEMAYEPSRYDGLVAIPISYFGRFTSWIAVRDDNEPRKFGQDFIKLCQGQFDVKIKNA